MLLCHPAMKVLFADLWLAVVCHGHTQKTPLLNGLHGEVLILAIIEGKWKTDQGLPTGLSVLCIQDPHKGLKVDTDMAVR